ncbi:MAG: hypothetical protein U0175_00125 [Caldilineaceae bacterium]
MDTSILLRTHSDFRYLVIAVVVLALLKLLIGLVSGSRWGRLDQIAGTAFPIVFDIQLLFGLVLWVVEQRWSGADPTRSWEHPVTMILAITAAHIAWSRAKKQSADAAKFRTAFFGFLIAGLLMGLGVARVTGVI